MKVYIKLFILAFVAMLVAASFGYFKIAGFCAVFTATAIGLTIGGIANWIGFNGD